MNTLFIAKRITTLTARENSVPLLTSPQIGLEWQNSSVMNRDRGSPASIPPRLELL